jgi:hypothetical protein
MRHFLAILGLLCALPAPAGADLAHDDEPQIVVIKRRCLPYWTNPDGDSPSRWSEMLSFAACSQEPTVGRVENIDELVPMLEQLEAELVPILRIYLYIVDNGPEEAKIRAAYHIGHTMLGLLVRARSSILAPPDLMTNARSAARYGELHARLEPMLQNIIYLTYISFGIVVRAADDNPWLAEAPETRELVRHAREVVRVLEPRAPREPTLTTRR